MAFQGVWKLWCRCDGRSGRLGKKPSLTVSTASLNTLKRSVMLKEVFYWVDGLIVRWLGVGR